MKKLDLVGQVYGKLTVLEEMAPHITPQGKKKRMWKCKCKCGNEVIVDTRNLNSGHTQSCGCKKLETKNVNDMTGYENDGIKVLERAGSDNQQIALWKCLCKY